LVWLLKGRQMWIVLAVCVAGFVLWRSNKRRAQRFVRAVCFLDVVDGGASTDEANGQVARMFSKHSNADVDNTAIRYAMDKADRFTDGKQLPWIKEARQRGFTIDSGNTRFDLAHLSQAQSDPNVNHEFSKHFSESQYSTSDDANFPHDPSLLSEAHYAGLQGLWADKVKLISACKAIAPAALRWAFRGAVAGFILGWFVPMTGPFRWLEPWAVPFLTAYLGSLAGLAIGTVHRIVRWVYSS
jgi:hypothetical protein